MSTRTATRALRRRPAPELHYFLARVVHTDRVTPRMARVILGGADLAQFIWDGPDQRVKVFLPLPGDEVPAVPSGDDWYARYRALPDEIRPVMRTYTVRGHNPARNEIEIHFALHTETSGPVSAWAARAQVGDYVGIYGPYADYDPVPDTDWQLILGDETALPAIGGIVEALPPGMPARVFAEVVDAAEDQSWETKGDVEITWLHRGAEADGSNSLLHHAVAAASLPVGRPYVWMGAEASVVKSVRRHLVHDRAYDRGDIYFAGYWRHGRAEDQRRPYDDE